MVRQQSELCDSFRGPHHADRIHRLVGREQDELLGLIGRGRLHQQICPQCIVFYRGEGILLHERNMLECSRMVDDLRSMPAKISSSTAGCVTLPR